MKSNTSRAVNMYDDDESSLTLYLREINTISLLSHEQEKELAIKAKNGDIEARNTLVQSHLRFVVNVAKKFQNQGMPLSDLISEGNMGLIHAIERFEPEQGYHFISYAVWWIKQSIMKALVEKSRSIRLPQNRANELIQIERLRRAMQSDNQDPSVYDIARILNMDASMVQDLLNVAKGQVSLDAPTKSDTDNQSTLDEYIQDERYPTPHVAAEKSALKQEIGQLLQTLPVKEAKVLTLRFGLMGHRPHSLKEVGEIFKLTKERIRQIEKKALATLREQSGDQLIDFL
jgi:RNA polymerase primary sigma factor